MVETKSVQFADRRSSLRTDLSATAQLREVPALVVLERLPVPVLAVEQDGTILFANQAFAAMLGRATESILEMKFADIFRTLPVEASAVTVLRSHADEIVELAHNDLTTVRAKMSRSALMRDDDRVALATFQDLTEQLWEEEP